MKIIFIRNYVTVLTLVYAVSDTGVEERFSVQGFSYQVLEVR